MSWCCEAQEIPVIEHWAICGTCGWTEQHPSQVRAQSAAAEHSRAHDEIWESSGGTDLGEHLHTWMSGVTPSATMDG